MDEIHERTGLQPDAADLAGRHRRRLPRRARPRATGDYRRFTRTAGGATIAPEEHARRPRPRRRARATPGSTPSRRASCSTASGQVHDQALFLAGVTTPVLFGSAVLELRRRRSCSTCCVELAPAARRRGPTPTGEPRPLDAPFSAFVFKVQAGMDTAHRDRLAFIRVCSGVFERGMVVTHAAHRQARSPPSTPSRCSAATARPSTWPTPATSSAWSTPPRCGVGDTPLRRPAGRPTRRSRRFAPGALRGRAAPRTPAATSSSAAGIEQLEQRGRRAGAALATCRGDQAPVLAAVGPMQFEVAEHRMEHEFGAPVAWTGCRTAWPGAPTEASAPRSSPPRATSRCCSAPTASCSALFADKWRLRRVQREPPGRAARAAGRRRALRPLRAAGRQRGPGPLPGGSPSSSEVLPVETAPSRSKRRTRSASSSSRAAARSGWSARAL